LAEHGVGRGTLRESLRFLELKGVISMMPEPGGGPIVEGPDSKDLAGTFLKSMIRRFKQAWSVVNILCPLSPG